MDTKGVQRPLKLPTNQLAILAICRFAEPLTSTSVFPYLPEMMESFGIDKTNVARWAGITSAVFGFAQCCTAIAWGRASDRFGRKPVVMIGMFITMFTSIFWGLSTSLPWAIITRALSGAGNGNVGIMRTMVAEMVPERELQPRAFSILPLVWAFGSTLGPALGGFFANPAENLPGLFGGNRFFIKFPFALPNLIASIFFAFGLCVGVLFLKETLETKKNRPDYGLYLGKELVAYIRGRPKIFCRKFDCSDDEVANALLSAAPTTPTQSLNGEQKSTNSKLSRPPPGIREVFTCQSTINLISYTFIALHAASFDQLLPVFLHHPRQTLSDPAVSLPLKFSGGFNLGSGRIGTLFTLFGICGGLIQFLIFPPVARRFGVLSCFKVCTVTFPLVYIATPFPALIQDPVLQQAAIFSIMVVKCFCVVFAFPCSTILLTNSALSLRILGTLNGFATSLSAIGRCIGPALCGALFTWGVEHGYVITPWWMLAAIATLGIIPVWCLTEMDGLNSLQNCEDGGEEEEEQLLASNNANEEDGGIISGDEVIAPFEVKPATERSPLLGQAPMPETLGSTAAIGSRTFGPGRIDTRTTNKRA